MFPSRRSLRNFHIKHQSLRFVSAEGDLSPREMLHKTKFEFKIIIRRVWVAFEPRLLLFACIACRAPQTEKCHRRRSEKKTEAIPDKEPLI